MPARTVKTKTQPKPTLVKIGKHYLEPTDIAGIKQAKQGLYIIILHSQPEPEFPLWLTEREFNQSKKYFNIVGETI